MLLKTTEKARAVSTTFIGEQPNGSGLSKGDEMEQPAASFSESTCVSSSAQTWCYKEITTEVPMNIEEIKEWRKRNMHHVIQGDADKIDWLIAEVERLDDELNAAKFVNCERCVEKTARRCAEIAENEKVGANENDASSDRAIDQTCNDIAAKIRREFSL